MQLQPGEFVGQTVENITSYFRAQTREVKSNSLYSLTPFIQFDRNIHRVTTATFRQVRKEIGAVVNRYPNIYR